MPASGRPRWCGAAGRDPGGPLRGAGAGAGPGGGYGGRGGWWPAMSAVSSWRGWARVLSGPGRRLRRCCSMPGTRRARSRAAGGKTLADAVLVDAPCSGQRDLAATPEGALAVDGARAGAAGGVQAHVLVKLGGGLGAARRAAGVCDLFAAGRGGAGSMRSSRRTPAGGPSRWTCRWARCVGMARGLCRIGTRATGFFVARLVACRIADGAMVEHAPSAHEDGCR